MDPTETREMIERHLTYVPEQGHFVWHTPTSRRVQAGRVAGTLRPDGYLSIMLNGYQFRVHHLVWLFETGQWPHDEIDHINRVRDDNRITNLRCVDRQVNACNGSAHNDTTTGVMGVTFNKRRLSRPWQVQISRLGEVIHRSYHDTLEDAQAMAEQVYASIR